MFEGNNTDHLRAYLSSKTGLFTSVRKRDGRVVAFDPKAITRAIAAAGRDSGEFQDDMAQRLTVKVIEYAYQMLTTEQPSVEDIQDIVEQLYGVEVSPTLVSEITADLDAEVAAWRNRRLDPVWPIVYFDGIVVHVRGASGRVTPHTMYVALGVNLEGKKELLGLWLGESEGAKFWLTCLTDLKNRGLNDILVACVDGLAGFPEAIRAAYPQTSVQLCIVHFGPRGTALRQHLRQPGRDRRLEEDLSRRDSHRGRASAR
ncbi:MAG: hypothetical protein HC825_03100 [Oscillatoriales cyanobacterium RM1_1_9]|nr:hypothetical protein [Oscillatoriales cyanobacterium RM1_1_9]